MAPPARPLILKAAPATGAGWHNAAITEVPASLLWRGQRRMEAESYLHEGFRIQAQLESKKVGWTLFANLADASAPPRIKQVLVSPEYGVPYLNTSQVFDPRPTPRKWLAMGKTNSATSRLVKRGTILVMASATVGRSIMATKAHENTIISHHFMRVVPAREKMAGWIYAFLRSPHARAMIDGTQYASVIRHIEPHHLRALPIPVVSDAIADRFLATATQININRNAAAELRDAADHMFAAALGKPISSESEIGFSVKLSAMSSGRRRFEAEYHSPRARSIISLFEKHERLGSLTEKIWWGKRFKRNYGDLGIPYLSADDLFTTNRYYEQKILFDLKDNPEDFFVREGWLLMACSGQTYGLNGAATIATKLHEGTFFSHDLIRIKPSEKIRTGYLLMALTHPTLGRPLLIREAYGMSIPHIDPDDVAGFPVVRLDRKLEDDIADLVEDSAKKLSAAEALEREIGKEAGEVISAYIEGREPNFENLIA